jgi:ubiquinone/menaquinone biosynthesis C-methylase UbiE
MDGEDLPFSAHRFDTVVDTLNLCTYPDPLRALREMARVRRPDGRILLLEHGRSSCPGLGRWQDRRAEAHAQRLGCRWNREPLELVRQAGLDVVEAERFFFGIFHCIAAAPPR